MISPEMSLCHSWQCPQQTDRDATEAQYQLQWIFLEKRRQMQVNSEFVYSKQELSSHLYDEQKKELFEISI